MKQVADRRRFLKGVAIAGATLAIPAVASTKAFAQAAASTPQQRRILEVARRELTRMDQQVWRQDIVGIADYGLPSSMPRLHFANMISGEVRSFLVAHGRGSDPEHDGFLKWFSNVPGSEATSRGAYITHDWYTGKWGTSIRLSGLDQENCNALDRAIVMHPAWYAAPEMLTKWGKLGRSEGCFAMSPADFQDALAQMAGGRLLFADRLGIA